MAKPSLKSNMEAIEKLDRNVNSLREQIDNLNVNFNNLQAFLQRKEENFFLFQTAVLQALRGDKTPVREDSKPNNDQTDRPETVNPDERATDENLKRSEKMGHDENRKPHYPVGLRVDENYSNPRSSPCRPSQEVEPNQTQSVAATRNTKVCVYVTLGQIELSVVDIYNCS